MKLIDLDQHITVPITDDHGTYTVEITVGEFFKRFLPGEQLKVVDAVPVIRCRDCKQSYENAKHVDLACEWSSEPDFYCAAGERMDDDADDRR